MYTIKYNLTPGKIKFISEETVKFSKYAACSQSPQSQTSPPEPSLALPTIAIRQPPTPNAVSRHTKKRRPLLSVAVRFYVGPSGSLRIRGKVDIISILCTSFMTDTYAYGEHKNGKDSFHGKILILPVKVQHND